MGFSRERLRPDVCDDGSAVWNAGPAVPQIEPDDFKHDPADFKDAPAESDADRFEVICNPATGNRDAAAARAEPDSSDPGAAQTEADPDQRDLDSDGSNLEWDRCRHDAVSSEEARAKWNAELPLAKPNRPSRSTLRPGRSAVRSLPIAMRVDATWSRASGMRSRLLTISLGQWPSRPVRIQCRSGQLDRRSGHSAVRLGRTEVRNCRKETAPGHFEWEPGSTLEGATHWSRAGTEFDSKRRSASELRPI
jgi:hypothetical protein